MTRMKTASLLALVCAVVVTTGVACRKDATATKTATAESKVTPHANTNARPQAAENEVTVRIRKLGGADGKQLMNELAVATPIGDDFAVTEQVGTKQLEFRGNVLDLKNGEYRISYNYTETSPDGVQNLKSSIEMPPNTEEKVGGLLGASGDETFVLSVSRP